MISFVQQVEQVLHLAALLVDLFIYYQTMKAKVCFICLYVQAYTLIKVTLLHVKVHLSSLITNEKDLIP